MAIPFSEMPTGEEQKPNVRIITIPEADESPRVAAAVREAAGLCGGEPVLEPHCTLHYLHNVDLDGVKVLQTELPEIARRVLTCRIEVTGVLVDWGALEEFPEDALVVGVAKTEALCGIYTQLADLAWACGLGDSSFKDYQWVPHMKIVEGHGCQPAELIAKVLPLIPRLSYAARSFCLSVRQEDGEWSSRGRAMLSEDLRGRLWHAIRPGRLTGDRVRKTARRISRRKGRSEP